MRISDWSSDVCSSDLGIARSYGHCMTMGTAPTMTAIAEALGLTLPGASSIPAADANHQRMCAAAGRRIVEMVWEDLTPDQIGRASCRERVCQYGVDLGGRRILKKKKTRNNPRA